MKTKHELTQAEVKEGILLFLKQRGLDISGLTLDDVTLIPAVEDYTTEMTILAVVTE